MSYTAREFRAFIRRVPHEGYDFVELDKDHFELRCPWALGLVTFWSLSSVEEVVELTIVRGIDGEPSFFLHFQVRNQEHAENLFGEMVEALLSLASKQVARIILSCSAGITTSYFVHRLNEAAQTLSLPYEFEAHSIDQLEDDPPDCSAILLAPQVSYRHKEIVKNSGTAPVLDIPAKVYGTYDAAACLAFVRAAIEDEGISEGITDAIQATITDTNVLVITGFYDALQTRIVWRLYVEGTIFLQGSAMKRRLQLHDIEDVVDVVRATTDVRIDRLVVTMPGPIDHGVMQMEVRDFHRGFDVEAYLESRYPYQVTVANNVNAAALGWYSQQDSYRSVTLHSQPRGNLRGGQGMVLEGRIVTGRSGMAGEVSHMLTPFLSDDLQNDVWDFETTLHVIGFELAMNIAVFAPEVIVIRSALTPDVNEIRTEIAQFIPESFIPELIHVESFDEYCLRGALLMGVEEG